MTTQQLIAADKYLTESFLDRCRFDKASETTKCLAERRREVALELRARGIEPSLLTQLAVVRHLIPNE